ncbi:MAG: hypothetical protein WCO96_03830 [Actinomycetes bacterium]
MSAATLEGSTGTRVGSDTTRRLVVGLALVLLLVSTVALWRTGSGLAKQACVDQVLARYPAVPVSAYTSPNSTALKLSFVGERQKALDSCN